MEVERCVGSVVAAIRDADPHRVIERHSHEDAHFVLVLGGTYVSTAREAVQRDRGPMLIYNPPGTTHRDHFAARHGVFAGRFFTLSVPAALDAEESGRGLTDGPARALRHPLALVLAAQLTRECRQWEVLSPMAIESLALELLSSTVRPNMREERHSPAWLARSVEQLYEQRLDRLSVGTLARDAGVHPVYLARAFRRFLGCGPSEFARRIRVQRAVMSLHKTQFPLSEIAFRCGYSDQSHMTREIRKLTGVSPAALRTRLTHGEVLAYVALAGKRECAVPPCRTPTY